MNTLYFADVNHASLHLLHKTLSSFKRVNGKSKCKGLFKMKSLISLRKHVTQLIASLGGENKQKLSNLNALSL